MAKAAIPMRAFREKFGDIQADDIGARLHDLVAQFLHEAQKEVRSLKSEVRSDGRSETEEVKSR